MEGGEEGGLNGGVEGLVFGWRGELDFKMGHGTRWWVR